MSYFKKIIFVNTAVFPILLFSVISFAETECDDGYTLDANHICVPYPSKTPPILELPTPESNTGWFAGAMTVLAGYPAWVLVVGGVAGVCASAITGIGIYRFLRRAPGTSSQSSSPTRRSGGVGMRDAIYCLNNRVAALEKNRGPSASRSASPTGQDVGWFWKLLGY